MKKPSYLLYVLGAAAILLLSVFAFKRYLPYTGTSLTPKQPPAIVLSMENAYLVGVGKNGKLWSVKAKKVEIGRNRSYTTVKGLYDGKIFESGKAVLKMSAATAVCDMFRKDLTLSGGINVKGLNGQMVTGDGAVWNSTTSTLRSMGPVDFQSKLGKISTDQLEVNVKNKEMNLRNIRMKVFVSEVDKQINQGAGKNAH